MKKALFFLMTLTLLTSWGGAVKAQSPLTIGTGTDYASVGNSGNAHGSALGNPYN